MRFLKCSLPEQLFLVIEQLLVVATVLGEGYFRKFGVSECRKGLSGLP